MPDEQDSMTKRKVRWHGTFRDRQDGSVFIRSHVGSQRGRHEQALVTCDLPGFSRRGMDLRLNLVAFSSARVAGVRKSRGILLELAPWGKFAGHVWDIDELVTLPEHTKASAVA